MTCLRTLSLLLVPIALSTLAGCGTQSPTPIMPAPGSAALVYSLSDQITATGTAASVVGYTADATGNLSPAVTISSTNPAESYDLLATDPSGNIYVLSAEFDNTTFLEVPGTAKILVFAPITSGTMTANPIRTITGAAANLDGAGLMAVDAAGNIYLWELGSNVPPIAPATIVEFAAGADGNVAPIRTINVAQFPSNDASGYREGLAVDSNGNIIFAVSNPLGFNGTDDTESDQIQIFTPGQSGNATPARIISGPQSQLAQIIGLSLDAKGNIYVEMATVETGANPSILSFAGGANPATSSAPLAVISGKATMLDSFVPNSLAVDTPGNIYVLDYTFPGGEANPTNLLRFVAGATGDAAPTAAVPSQVSGTLAVH